MSALAVWSFRMDFLMEFKRSIECDKREGRSYEGGWNWIPFTISLCATISCDHTVWCHIWSTPKTFFYEQMIKEKGIRGLYGSLTPFPVTQVVSL
jgi:hypothetical protein